MKTILVVEDEKTYREMLELKLTQSGYAVLTAENGQKGLELLGNSSVDLILLDLMMPTLDGNTFLYFLNERQIAVPVIILTNLTQTAVPDKPYEYIVKANISLDELVQRIHRTLQGHQPHS